MQTIKTLFASLMLLFTLSCKAETKRTETALLVAEENPAPVKQHFIKVALLLDTSNSMDGLIDQAKAQLWELVNDLSYAKCKAEKPNLKIALYEYGNDGLNPDNGFIRKILAFTEDLDDVSERLFSLTTNGGSEYCGTVIKTSLDELEWGNDGDDLKMIFIAGNEPFTQGNIHYRDAALQAIEKNVVVNTIFCGDYTQGIQTQWKDGAVLTFGDYMAIDQNQKTVHIASPYDDKILQLNIQLNGTYVPYGAHGREKEAKQAEQDANAVGYGKANAVKRAVTKSSHLYKNSSWDLVDAEEESTFSYETIQKEQLPKELQSKSTEELKEYVDKQRKERKRITEEIAKLNKKRADFVSQQQKEDNKGLGNAMIKSLRSQASKKGYVWE